MLRKQPGERYTDARAVDAALEEALKQADETWEVPLCETWDPHHATTERQKDMWAGGDLLALYERLASYAQRPMRGKPRPPDEVSTLDSAGEEPPGEVEPPPAPAVEPASSRAPPVDEVRVVPASREESESAAPPAAPVATEETSPTALTVDTAPLPSEELIVATEPPPAPARPATRSRRALLAAGVLGVLGLGVWLVMHPPRASEILTLPVGAPRADLPPEFYPVTLELGGQEVAPSSKRPEGDGGAAPEAAPTPAPVARATPSKDTRVKTPAKAPAPQQPKPQPKKTSSVVGTVGAVAATCTLASGCVGPTTPQVRPSPQAGLSAPQRAECPPGAVESMKQLGLRGTANAASVSFLGHVAGGKFTTVRPGAATLVLDSGDWGKLPEGTQFSGQLLFGEERVYGRFTQAHAPGGDTYPVCLELRGESARVEDRGMPKQPGSGQDTARVREVAYLAKVESFE
ncbi:hypothetical protein DAT35_12680 [Vitiosangium sp. GDMCC 1.1324]|nr:hypothetical protein DAT35_12680 [Vitiosangium sp. GDMCC 1.1324]